LWDISVGKKGICGFLPNGREKVVLVPFNGLHYSSQLIGASPTRGEGRGEISALAAEAREGIWEGLMFSSLVRNGGGGSGAAPVATGAGFEAEEGVPNANALLHRPPTGLGSETRPSRCAR